MRRRSRIAALVLTVLFLCGVLCGFSGALLLARYPAHTCCGERCSVCVALSVVDAMLRQSGLLPAAGLLWMAVLAACFACVKGVCRFRLSVRTPITLKTKLLN